VLFVVKSLISYNKHFGFSDRLCEPSLDQPNDILVESCLSPLTPSLTSVESKVVEVIEKQPLESPRFSEDPFLPIVDKQPEPKSPSLENIVHECHNDTRVIDAEPTLHEEIAHLQTSIDKSLAATNNVDSVCRPKTLLEQAKAVVQVENLQPDDNKLNTYDSMTTKENGDASVNPAVKPDCDVAPLKGNFTQWAKKTV